MKLVKTLSLCLILLASVSLSAQSSYAVDKSASVVNWKGFKPTGEHYGTVTLADGKFEVNGTKIVGGSFKIDMNTIVDIDIPADSEYNAKLVNHLKSDDFFGVNKHPYATFEITSVENKDGKLLVNGNLIIKDISNPVSFTAKAEMSEGKLLFESDTFKIDRSKWNIKYKSKSFFSDLADNFIYDDMEISVKARASK